MEWSVPETDGGAEILGYLVERREAGTQQWSRVDYTDTKTFKAQAKNLLEGRPYVFRVTAENKEGLSDPANLTVTPFKPIGE